MSNKPFNRLWDAEQIIRKSLPIGMEDGVKLTIEYIAGFELWNTRPYHNYETWSAGWRVSGPIGAAGTDPIVVAEAEDLDDAFALWIKRCDDARLSVS